MPVLVLSSPQDAHARAVTEQLAGMGEEFRYWSVGDLLTESKLNFNLRESGFDCRIEHEGSGDALRLPDFQSVWLRRPRPIRSKPLPESWMESAVNWETTRAVDAIFRMLPCLWVNNPTAQI